jgi:hypothetical protein
VIAVGELSEAVRELAGELEQPERESAARETAWRAARRATALLDARHADLATNMLVGQVRSTAVDLTRGAGMEPSPPSARPTTTPPSTRPETPSPKTDPSRAHKRHAARAAAANLTEHVAAVRAAKRADRRCRHPREASITLTRRRMRRSRSQAAT